MRIKLARVGVLLASVLSLLGLSMPPAEATQVGTVAFVGNAFVGGGLGFPCTPFPGNPAALLAWLATFPGCLPTPGATTKPKLLAPNVNVTWTGGAPRNTRAFTFGTVACLGFKVSVIKPGKGTGVDGPLCAITAGGTVDGFCGFSNGAGAGTIVIGLKTQFFTFKFWGLAGTLFVSGTYAGAVKAGTITGVVDVTPDPNAATGSCTTKTGTSFTLEGGATLFDFNV